MQPRSLKFRRLLALTGLSWLAAALLSFGGAARAQNADPSPSTDKGSTQNTPSTGGDVTGDWGGLRTRLAKDGVDVTARYTSESVYNPTGGTKSTATEAGQFDVGVTLDMGKLAGLTGGTFKATATWREGEDLGRLAGIPELQQVQEIYGRGQTWRLTQFWYEQAIGPAKIKVGRSSPGEDFDAFSCHFENLAFCGSPPGNIVGDYWYNWPVPQWSARLKVDLGPVYVQAGAYEINPLNLGRSFLNFYFHGATGVLAPIEVGYRKLNGLVGNYRLGGWYASGAANDVSMDVDGGNLFATGLPAMRREGRYGAWISLQQQLSGTSRDGKSVSGLSVFLNATQADRRTSTTDQQIALGVFYKGLIPRVPEDVLGLAIARTEVNPRAAEAEWEASLYPIRRSAEYEAEIYYSLNPFPWLVLRPNLQVVHQPGGRPDLNDAVVLGLKAALTL